MFGISIHKSRQTEFFKSLNGYRTGSKYNNTNTIISIPITTIYTGPFPNISKKYKNSKLKLTVDTLANSKMKISKTIFNKFNSKEDTIIDGNNHTTFERKIKVMKQIYQHKNKTINM